MHICIAGPVSLDLLDDDFGQTAMPSTLGYPLGSALANKLAEMGHRLTLVTTSQHCSSVTRTAGRRMTLRIVPMRRKYYIYDFYRTERSAMCKEILDAKPDIVVAQWSYEYAWAAQQSKLPCVVWLHDHAATILYYRRDLYQFLRYVMDFVAVRRARALIANSEYMYNLLAPLARKQCTIIQNSLPDIVFQLAEELRELPPRRQVITVANGDSVRKNLRVGLLAMDIVLETLPDYVYLLVGDGMVAESKLGQFAQGLRNSSRIRFLGPQAYTRVLALIRESKVLLHPSLEESFGMTVAEAMALKVPLVGGTKSGNVPYLLGHGERGWLCDVSAPRLVATTVINAIENATATTTKADVAERYVADNLRIASCAKSVEAFLGRTAGEGNARA